MTRQRNPTVVAVLAGLCSIGSAAAAWPHHPIPPTDAGGGGPGSLVWWFGAGVFVVVFVATWAVFSLLERRQQARSQARESARRSSCDVCGG